MEIIKPIGEEDDTDAHETDGDDVPDGWGRDSTGTMRRKHPLAEREE